ncbi:MAG: ABC transporter permease [Deltaproteobacteria bacterium]|nr:ABC transporter permease [Deltaproteobacteria bacterium]MBI3388524.1 ABC transporter permease [Deltaproteobacteria bacterium]
MALGDALSGALRLLLTLDTHVWSAVIVSLRVSLLATVLSVLIGLPIGFLVAARQFSGRRVIEILLNTATALPTVVVGLLVYALLSRRGLLGPLGLLYTQSAMVIGETILVAPLMAALTVAVVSGADPRIEETALTLGASRFGAAISVFVETQRGLLAAITTSFGRLISELGIALMVGGNILDSTRTMTTTIALETSKGDLALGFALGLILLSVALAVNGAVAVLTPSRA